MARALLHVGLPKCGSSALQTRLISNQARLLEHGLIYPTPHTQEGTRPETIETMPMAHMNMMTDLVALSRSAASGEPTKLNTYVEDFHRSAAHTLILSSESMANRIGRISPDLLAPLRPFAIDILLFYRRADAYALALFKQAVRRQRYRGDFPDFLASEDRARNPGPDIVGALDGIRCRFPAARFHIHDLDDPEGAGDTIAIAGALLGLPLSDWPTLAFGPRTAALVARGERVNGSYTDDKTLFLLLCNRSELSDEALKAIDIALATMPDEPDEEGTLMNRRQSRELLARFAQVNAGMKQRFDHCLVPHEVDRRLTRGISRRALSPARRAAMIEQIVPLLTETIAAELRTALG